MEKISENESCGCSSHKDTGCGCSSKASEKCGSIFMGLLMLILIMLSSIQIAFLYRATQPSVSRVSQSATTQSGSNSLFGSSIEDMVRNVVLEQEYAKAGGKEAYETMITLQKALVNHPQNPNNLNRQKEMLKMLQENDGQIMEDTTHNNNGNNGSADNLPILDESARESIISDAVVEGNKDAPIMVVEYSDLECPYCIMQHNENKIGQKLKEEFGDKLAYSLKNHRGVNHSGTEIKALSLLCANKVGGKDAYVSFYKAIFEGSDARSGKIFDVEKLGELAEKAGIDKNAWNSCVENKETLTQFEGQTEEAKKYGMRGTPGALIFNTKTGKYTTVIGARDYGFFSQAVKNLLSE